MASELTCEEGVVANGDDRGGKALAPHVDEFCWQKYGQKSIMKGAFTRSYYRCTLSSHGCSARKMVDLPGGVPGSFHVHLHGTHSHGPLKERGALKRALGYNDGKIGISHGTLGYDEVNVSGDVYYRPSCNQPGQYSADQGTPFAAQQAPQEWGIPHAPQPPVGCYPSAELSTPCAGMNDPNTKQGGGCDLGPVSPCPPLKRLRVPQRVWDNTLPGPGRTMLMDYPQQPTTLVYPNNTETQWLKRKESMVSEQYLPLPAPTPAAVGAPPPKRRASQLLRCPTAQDIAGGHCRTQGYADSNNNNMNSLQRSTCQGGPHSWPPLQAQRFPQGTSLALHDFPNHSTNFATSTLGARTAYAPFPGAQGPPRNPPQTFQGPLLMGSAANHSLASPPPLLLEAVPCQQAPRLLMGPASLVRPFPGTLQHSSEAVPFTGTLPFYQAPSAPPAPQWYSNPSPQQILSPAEPEVSDSSSSTEDPLFHTKPWVSLSSSLKENSALYLDEDESREGSPETRNGVAPGEENGWIKILNHPGTEKVDLRLTL